MAYPSLTPTSEISVSKLSATGSASDVASALPFGIYSSNTNFLSGAAEQVAYTYKMLGGDVLDIELVDSQVYAAYEAAVLDYSYIVNLHQAKNVLPDVLGATSGTFDHDGDLLTGTDISLKKPKVTIDFALRYADQFSAEAMVGGTKELYSGSIDIVQGTQTYDLQEVFSGSNANVGNNRVVIKKVYYRTPQSIWRFFGYYGTLNVIGNLSSYGQFSDDSTFELIPVWQNKLQAIAYEDALYTRYSHYSYRVTNNKLTLFPSPSTYYPDKIWILYTIQNENEPWEEDSNKNDGANGINNMNTLPFGNIPYENINSIGKNWIRRYCLAICKEMLGWTRTKFATIPVPGESITLNGEMLLTRGSEEKEKLKEELKTVLDELTYTKVLEESSKRAETARDIISKVPLPIYKF